jgi:site-specific DNA recombinase
MARADHARVGLNIRCAIYTRKSSDEGLEQEFNSLDAQREACEAYIVSQRHAGWVALANMYDDGGLSGGRWSGLPSSGFWRTSRPARFRPSLSTRSIA